MPQTLLMTVDRYEIDAGTNTTNPLGLMIRVTAHDSGGAWNLRLYFYSPDAATPQLVGWRASFDGALVLFLQRHDFSSYLLMLDQAKANYIRAQLEDNDEITFFEISTAPFPPVPMKRKITDADLDELKNRTTKS